MLVRFSTRFVMCNFFYNMLKYFIGTKVPIFLPIKREHFNRNTFAANIEQRESCSTRHSWFKELWYSTHIRIKPCTAGVTFSSLTERSGLTCHWSSSALCADGLKKLNTIHLWFHSSFHEKESVSCPACQAAHGSALTFHCKWVISQ